MITSTIRLWHLATAALITVGLGFAVVVADSAHRDRETRPVPLGSSGGNIEHIDSGWCCGGTLGALVEDPGGSRYILSNNHVIARFNRASTGENVVQPGLIEVGCAQRPGDVVADVTDFVAIKRNGVNRVDAAIARVRDGYVDQGGEIRDIGTLSAETMAASLNLAVKKSGRTTGLTRGHVSAVDVTVNVGYSTQCGGPVDFVARFRNQFRVVGSSGSFSQGGDSGSLIVEDVTDQPRAVGLLFAGSSSSTVANPIDDVLAAFGVAMVGGAVDPPPTGSVTGFIGDSVGPVSGAMVQVDTGQSTLTDGGGSYAITDVPTGQRTVTASKDGYLDQQQGVGVSEGGTAVADFALVPAPPPAGVTVGCITYETYGGRSRGKHLRITTRVVDDQGTPVTGVGIAADIFLDGAFLSAASATTDASGHAVIEIKNAADGTYRTDVTNVDGFGDPFEPANQFAKGSPGSASLFGACAGSQGGRGQLRRIDPGAVGRAIAAKRRSEAQFFAASNQVVGIGVGVAGGEPAIEVYLATGDPQGRRRLPERIDGFRVEPVVTGLFTAGLECERVD